MVYFDFEGTRTRIATNIMVNHEGYHVLDFVRLGLLLTAEKYAMRLYYI